MAGRGAAQQQWGAAATARQGRCTSRCACCCGGGGWGQGWQLQLHLCGGRVQQQQVPTPGLGQQRHQLRATCNSNTATAASNARGWGDLRPTFQMSTTSRWGIRLLQSAQPQHSTRHVHKQNLCVHNGLLRPPGVQAAHLLRSCARARGCTAGLPAAAAAGQGTGLQLPLRAAGWVGPPGEGSAAAPLAWSRPAAARGRG